MNAWNTGITMLLNHQPAVQPMSFKKIAMYEIRSKIIAALTEKPADVKDIAERVGLDVEYVRRTLKEMLFDGKVVRKKKASQGVFIYEVVPCPD